MTRIRIELEDCPSSDSGDLLQAAADMIEDEGGGTLELAGTFRSDLPLELASELPIHIKGGTFQAK